MEIIVRLKFVFETLYETIKLNETINLYGNE